MSLHLCGGGRASEVEAVLEAGSGWGMGRELAGVVDIVRA